MSLADLNPPQAGLPQALMGRRSALSTDLLQGFSFSCLNASQLFTFSDRRERSNLFSHLEPHTEPSFVF